MGVKVCVECEEQGPEFPAAAAAREIHRALHGLGRRFLEVLDPIVEALAVPKIKPLEHLDSPDVPELPLVMGGKVVGVSIFDGKGGMRGTVTDPDAIAALLPQGGGYSVSAGPYPVLPPMAVSTRPEDWAPGPRAIIWPEGNK